MNFEFSDEILMLRDQAERLFAARDARTNARAILGGNGVYDEAVWKEMAALGWTGAGIPEEFGGLGFGPQALCIIAEELGRSLAAVPFSSSICQAAEAILRMGSPQQKLEYLPPIASGDRIATFAAPAVFGHSAALPEVRKGAIHARDLLIVDAMVADLLVIAAHDDAGNLGLYLVDLRQDGVDRSLCATVDPTRNHGRVSLDGADAVPLGRSAVTQGELDRLIARIIIPVAFEQVGGAAACLDMARDYACERHAFGRPIGSFQAIKHKLARMFILNELARSNANYGAWALATDALELEEISATARLSALRAYHFASREALEVYGGMGFTWEADCHLYLRRAKLLAASHGGTIAWSERLISRIETRYMRGGNGF